MMTRLTFQNTYISISLTLNQGEHWCSQKGTYMYVSTEFGCRTWLNVATGLDLTIKMNMDHTHISDIDKPEPNREL